MSPGKAFGVQPVQSDACKGQMRKQRPERKGLPPATEDAICKIWIAVIVLILQ